MLCNVVGKCLAILELIGTVNWQSLIFFSYIKELRKENEGDYCSFFLHLYVIFNENEILRSILERTVYIVGIALAQKSVQRMYSLLFTDTGQVVCP